MSDEYPDEPPPPVPTFSDGSSGGGRAANSRAAASRAFASKSAVSAASRASAIMAATIQQLPKNAIITSSGIRTIQSNKPVNSAAIQLAQKRASIIIQNANAPQTIVQKVPMPDFMPVIHPRPVIHPKPVAPVIHPKPVAPVTPKITTNTQAEPPKNTQAEPPKKTQYKPLVLEEYALHVDAVRKKKEELLLLFTPRKQFLKAVYPSVKNIEHKTLTEDRAIDKDALDQLSKSLLSVINQSDKTRILDEFNKYETAVRISIEERLHKTAIQNALTNKALYLTSDA